jgi:hypothetical protein
MAKIVNGTVDFKSDNIDGMTVSEVRDEYGDILQIAGGSRATVGGEEVSSDFVLSDEDTLVFDQPTGAKGN